MNGQIGIRYFVGAGSKKEFSFAPKKYNDLNCDRKLLNVKLFS